MDVQELERREQAARVQASGAGSAADGARGLAQVRRAWQLTRKVGLWVAIGVAGFALNEGLTMLRDRALERPDYLQQIAAKQDEQFRALEQSLGRISGSIASGDRAAFAVVRDSIQSIERTNRGLLSQLELARRENETLRKAARPGDAAAANYDFLLAEDGGYRVDASTVVGLQSVGGGGARVNVSSANGSEGRFLNVGESLAFRGASGKACRVSLVSINGSDVGAATFALGCT